MVDIDFFHGKKTTNCRAKKPFNPITNNIGGGELLNVYTNSTALNKITKICIETYLVLVQHWVQNTDSFQLMLDDCHIIHKHYVDNPSEDNIVKRE